MRRHRDELVQLERPALAVADGEAVARERGENIVAPDVGAHAGDEDVVAHARALPGVRDGGLRRPLKNQGADEDDPTVDEVRQRRYLCAGCPDLLSGAFGDADPDDVPAAWGVGLVVGEFAEGEFDGVGGVFEEGVVTVTRGEKVDVLPCEFGGEKGAVDSAREHGPVFRVASLDVVIVEGVV